MKALRYLLTSLTIFLIGISLTSCHDESRANKSETQQKASNNQPSDSVSDVNKEVKDSLSRYSAKIDAVSKHAQDAINKANSVQKDVSGIQDNEIWWTLSSVVSIIALVISFVCLYRLAESKERLDRHRDGIQEIIRKIRNIQSIQKSSSEKNSTPPDYESLKQSVYNLERRIRELSSTPSPIQLPFETIVYPVPDETNGYFGNPINAAEPYFKKLLVSRDSDARFSAEISGDRAIFKPLDSASYLGTFVSNDAMRAAVEFEGCAPSRATSMQVKSTGEATQRDNKWIISKKAIVFLS